MKITITRFVCDWCGFQVDSADSRPPHPWKTYPLINRLSPDPESMRVRIVVGDKEEMHFCKQRCMDESREAQQQAVRDARELYLKLRASAREDE